MQHTTQAVAGSAGGRQEFPGFRRGCLHPSARWVHGGRRDALVCECCGAVLEEGWPDHHPAISRWLNEGGAVTR